MRWKRKIFRLFGIVDGLARSVRHLPGNAIGLVMLGLALVSTAAAGGGAPPVGLVSFCPRQAEVARARLHARKAVFAAGNLPPSRERRQTIRSEQESMADALAALLAQPPPVVGGWREEAYICPADDSAQPFVRYLPRSWHESREPGLPLVVYLHGYSPSLNKLNWLSFPPALTNLAEELDFAVAMPFGRSNTDFQGIGEQDVFRVIHEMQVRYRTDPERVVLTGFSMGGMGVWTIGTRFAERFAGLLPVAARGDYYRWQQLAPGDLPPWRRLLIDDAFPRARLERLAGLPVLAFHGDRDIVINIGEAEKIMDLVVPHNPAARLEVLPGKNHWIVDDVLAHPETRRWLRQCLEGISGRRPPPLGIRPGLTPSRLQNAFLDPFAFVVPREGARHAAWHRVNRRADEWYRFAKAAPRILPEEDLTAAAMEKYNLFVFGEPEHSSLVRSALRRAGGEWDGERFVLGGRELPRRGAGLWLAIANPAHPARTLVVQCGVDWGAGLPDNHRYDALPDVLAYRADGSVLAGGYMNDRGRVIWMDNLSAHPVQ